MVTNEGTKLCGIINEPFQGYDTLYSVIGMGLHVNNMNTTCLKSLIHSNSYISRYLSSDLVTYRAFILSAYLFQFCTLLRIYDQQGFEGISAVYYAHWENYHQHIDIGASGEMKEKVRLIGITDDGYLKGEDSHDQLLELYPDRNCEDSLANLIAHTLYPLCNKQVSKLQYPPFEVNVRIHLMKYPFQALRAWLFQFPDSFFPFQSESSPFLQAQQNYKKRNPFSSSICF